MKVHYKKYSKIDFEICAAPDYLSLEFVDENDDAFMQIKYNDNKEFSVDIYKNDNNFSIPLDKFEEGIRILKNRVNEQKI